MKRIFSNRVSLGLAMLSAASVAVACSDSTTPGSAAPAAVVAATSLAASSEVATAITGPSVRVTDAAGNPVAGVQVTFTASGGGAVQFPIATTKSDGIASAGLWQIGPKVGANKVTATVSGLSPIDFTVNSVAGPAAAIGISSGNNQTGAPGATLAAPLAARVTDAGGNPKSGVAVTFQVVSGGGSLATTTATTNSSGVATSGAWTLGTGQCSQSATATAASFTTTFTASSRGSIATGDTKSGTLSAADCVINGTYSDEYDLTTGAGAINVAMNSSDFDAVGQVVSADGSTIIASDANSGGGTNSSFRLITASGAKAVRATSALAGETGAYTVSVSSTSTDVNDCSAVYLEIGASTDQTLTTADCKTNNKDLGYGGGQVNADAFFVYIPAGVTVRISQSSYPLDALLELYNPAGSVVALRDNAGVNAATPEVIVYTAQTSGFYKIVATSYGLVFNDPYSTGAGSAQYGAYTLSVTKP